MICEIPSVFFGPGEGARREYDCGKWETAVWKEEVAATFEWRGAQQERQQPSRFFIQVQVKYKVTIV